MKLSTLKELSIHGVPFKFEYANGEVYTCIFIYFEDAAVLMENEIQVFNALDRIYTAPTRCLYPYLMQSLHGDHDIRPIVLFRFSSEEDATIYCKRHDYKIIRKLDAEKI